MKKLYTKSILALILIFSFSCEDINEDINANPNDILISDVGSCTEKLDTPPDDLRVQGRDLLTGKPKEKIISYIEVTKAVDKSVIRIEDSIMETLSQTPPELAADIYNTGIYLAGGGALLRGLDERLSKKTDLPVYIAEDPLQAVVRGTGICLKNLEKFKSVLIK